MGQDYTLREAAKQTGLSLGSLRQRVKRGALETVQVSRGKRSEKGLTEEQLDSLLEKQTKYDAIESDFIEAMRAVGLSGKPSGDRHIKNLKSYLTLYWQKLGGQKDIARLDADGLQAVFAQYQPNKEKRQFYHATKIHIHKSVATFLVYLVSRKLAKLDTLEQVRKAKPRSGHRVHRPVVTLAEVYKAIEVNADWTHGRSEYDVASMDVLLALYAFAGIRKHEAINLRVSDLAQGGKALMVYGKGSVERVVPIFPVLRKHLTSWKQYRSKKSIWLIPKPDGEQLTLRGVEKKFSNFKEKVSFEITPHALRRSFATTASLWGMPDALVQLALGHKHRQTTELYKQLKESDLMAFIERNPLMFASEQKQVQPSKTKPKKKKPASVWF